MSEADRRFDTSLSAALKTKDALDLREFELGRWSEVCAVGEGRPSHMLLGRKPAPGERAFETFIDAGSTYFGPGRGALAFVYDAGVEVRPLSDLSINMGHPINRCVPRSRATLVTSADLGWHFLGYEGEP